MAEREGEGEGEGEGGGEGEKKKVRKTIWNHTGSNPVTISFYTSMTPPPAGSVFFVCYRNIALTYYNNKTTKNRRI